MLNKLKYVVREDTWALLEQMAPDLRASAELLIAHHCRESGLGSVVLADEQFAVRERDHIHLSVELSYLFSTMRSSEASTPLAPLPASNSAGQILLENSGRSINEADLRLLHSRDVHTNWELLFSSSTLEQSKDLSSRVRDDLLVWARESDPDLAMLVRGERIPVFAQVRLANSGNERVVSLVRESKSTQTQLASDLAKIEGSSAVTNSSRRPITPASSTSISSAHGPRVSGDRQPKTATSRIRILVAAAVIIALGVAGGTVLLRDTDATSPTEQVSTDSVEQSTLAVGSNAEATSLQTDDTTDQAVAGSAVADSALDVVTVGPATAGDSNIFPTNADTTTQSSSGEMETVSASYDCTASGLSATEALICATPALRKLDAEMARAYRARRTAKLTVVGQQEWLRSRSSCLSSDRREVQIACLTASYDQRITQLREGV